MKIKMSDSSGCLAEILSELQCHACGKVAPCMRTDNSADEYPAAHICEDCTARAFVDFGNGTKDQTG